MRPVQAPLLCTDSRCSSLPEARSKTQALPSPGAAQAQLNRHVSASRPGGFGLDFGDSRLFHISASSHLSQAQRQPLTTWPSNTAVPLGVPEFEPKAPRLHFTKKGSISQSEMCPTGEEERHSLLDSPHLWLKFSGLVQNSAV